MSRSLRLRRWQKEALDLLELHPDPDFLAVATPGAGKTTFALTAVLRHLARNPRNQVVVVAPTSHLKTQWAHAASQVGLQLEPNWVSNRGMPTDMHGVAVTYQQVAANPAALRRVSARCVVVLDELHHAGDERAWGLAIREAFEGSPRRIALSGTPFRSDTHAIPFVQYVNDEAEPNFNYGYEAALDDRRVVRPVYFPTIDGFMEWTSPDGAELAAGFDDALNSTLSAQRLRTALSLESEWLPAVLHQANDRLMALRQDQGNAAGLVVATDQDHARGIADLLRIRFRAPAIAVTSDDPQASARIAAFADGDAPWLVAVRMVSEGVDIPRLRLGVFATTTTTELFFRQVVGRFVRHTGGKAREEKAWLFIPNDPRLRRFASTIAESRRHSLRRNWEDGERDETESDPAAFDELPVEGEQQSLFQVLSAQVIDTAPTVSTFDDDPDLDQNDSYPDTTVAIDLPVPPPPGRSRSLVPSDGRPLAEVKKELRDINADLVRQLVRITGLGHKEINSRLNRGVGILRIAEADAEQLKQRVLAAEEWLRKPISRHLQPNGR